MIKKHLHRINRIAKKLSLKESIAANKISKKYRQNTVEIKKVSRDKNTFTAVIIHLYYPENWNLFKKALTKLQEPFDLFITLPPQHSDYSEQILKSYKHAYIFVVPNIGRDVLPFAQIAQHLTGLDYKYILKLHSKKSTHRTDGNRWLSEMVENLLPPTKRAHNELIEILRKKNTGLIGPRGQYLSLSVNFDANGVFMTDIISNIYSKETAYRTLQLERTLHGFFAGTMFWARLDTITPVIEIGAKPSNYPKESGQIDGTFAHAMERIFCLAPQIEDKAIYEMSPKGISKIRYDSGTVPDWSNVYIGPQPKSI